MKRILSIILLTACLFALPVSAAADAPLVYRDVRTNASFTLPEDWEQASLTEDYNFIDAKFADIHDPSRIILYSSSDAFSYSTESERAGRTRADYHVYALSPEDFEGMYDVSREDVTAITKGENKYFVFPVTQEQKYYETTRSVTMICAATMYDGYMYMFQYSGDPKSLAYLDFLSVLESAEFPNRISPDGSLSQEQQKSSEYSMASKDIIIAIIVSVIVIIGVIVFVRWITKPDPEAVQKEWHAEGKITDEQFMQIVKRYNKLRAEMRDIRERIEVLRQIENSPEP